MPQVSKIPISKEVSDKIFDLFLDCFYNLQNTEEVNEFISDFLTPTEITMVTKRIAIVVLLSRGYDYDSIKDILKVSNSAVSACRARMVRMSETTKKKIDKILAKKKIKEFFIKIESLLDIVPPKGGRWADWQKERREKEMQIQEPF